MEEQKVADYFIVAGLEQDNPIPLKVTDETTEAFARKVVKDPITDLVVINRSAGEQVPDGFTCVEETPAGSVADLNAGSFRCPQMFLCYKRGREKAPLVHIGVLFEGRDRLLPHCEAIRETPEGRCANVNNGNNTKTFIYFKRAVANQSSPTDLVVTEVCIVIRDEKPPHTFWKISDRNLNNTFMGADVFLCYKKAMVNRNYLMYQPGLLFRYPKQDDGSLALPLDVATFSMPMGVSLEAWPRGTNLPRPVFAKFVLTVSGNGSQVYSGGSKMVQKLYGAALSFYEPVPKERLQPDQLEQLLHDLPRAAANEDAASDAFVFYATKSICLLSRWPFFEAFQSFLQHILAMALSPGVSHSVAIERVILHLLRDVPFPSLDRPKVLIQLPSSPVPIPLARPDDSPIPSNGSSFSTLLKNMPAEACANMLLLALLEQKICLHSLRPDVLTAVAESVTAMVFPFVWQCPYVPLCPVGLCGLLHAPVPFIVGVDSRYFDLYEPPSDVIYIDLDTGSIDLPADKRDLTVKLLPKKATKALLEKLEKITSKMLKEVANATLEKKNKAKAPATSASVPGEREFRSRLRTRQFDAEIQEVFLHFMVSVMKGYRNFLKPMVSAPTAGSTDPASLFDVEGFLRSRDKTYQKFYETLTRTQQFIRFIEERSIMSDREASYSMAFFDHCVERVEKEGHNADIRLLETEGNLGDHTVFLPPLEADPSGEKFTYGRAFPTLRPEMFDEPSGTDNHDVTLVPESLRSTVPAGDLATSRTKQEAKSAVLLAQHVNQRPKQWAKYLVSTGYAVWFMTLPSFIASSTSPSRALRAAFDTLKKMLTARIQPADEVCYRIMIQLCGQYHQPALAVKVLFEMKNHRIQPDAVTYGYYNRVVYESHWPSVAHSPEMLWMKVRHVVRGVHLFRQAGQQRRERRLERGDQVDEGVSAGWRPNGASTQDENKRDTGGSSDTGFFSLEHEDKRNSMVSLTSGEFLASIAELKASTKDVSILAADTAAAASVTASDFASPAAPQIGNGGIVRRSRIASAAATTIPGFDLCSTSLLMVCGNDKISDAVFDEGKDPNKPAQAGNFQRRHRSLSGDPRLTAKSPRQRKRHFSTSGLKNELPSSGRNGLKWKKDDVTTVSLSTLLTAAAGAQPHQRVSTPATTTVFGTVEVLDEHVKTVDLPSPISDFDEEDEERDKMESKRRSGKSFSVPREVNASGSLDDVSASSSASRIPHSTSSDFAATASSALPKLGAFLRNTKSYSSMRKFWGSGDKRKAGGADSPTAETASALSAPADESSSLAKGGAVLMSGMKSVTSALSKKIEEITTNLTTASPGSYSPSRAGSSLRDIPGALNFDYDADDFEDGQPSPEDDEDEYRGDQVDAAPFGKNTWHFPTYNWSPKHSGRPENVLVHADIVSVVLCQQCKTLVYDEEIMTGWFPNESNLNTKCPYCATNFLPKLSIAVYEHYPEDESHPSHQERRNSSCPLLGTLKSTRASSLSTVENSDGDNRSRTPLPTHDVTFTADSVASDAEVPDGACLSQPSESEPHSVPELEATHKEVISRSSSRYGPPSSVCRSKRSLKVPYLSPLQLRKQLETLIVTEGAVCMTEPVFCTRHDVVYWNLVWYCERLALPQNFTGLLIGEDGFKLLNQLGHATSLTSRSRFVSITCRWDDPFMASDSKCGLPLYLRFGNQSELLPSNTICGENDKPAISHNLMVQMLMRIRDESDLLTPMRTFLHAEQKQTHGDTRHRSLYRELLFLTVRALDNDNIDKLAFDKVYKASFNELRKDGDLMGILQADDRPLSLTAGWCRQAFRPLQL
ncbi:DENN domain-containing protein 4C [Hypsibius exemplaris]|uniref:DENN domain-containing protein 4C n=1 Tax=Hypsibius exemplaris TaxID=2072580 RepID=A0A1W0W9I1_HYPEX|nr:DENN domain-containing protein 4C [Hypsibius exemplaris]